MAAAATSADDDDAMYPFFSSTMLFTPSRQQEEDHHNQTTTDRLLVDQNNNHSYYLHSLNSHIHIRQLPSQGLSFQLWPAATTLVALLDNHSGPLSSLLTAAAAQHNRPLRILELGSGTGLVGIATAALLAVDVTVTDLPHVLPNLHFNVEANSKLLQVNGRGAKVNVAALSWGVDEDMKAIGREYDLIVGSDVVYHDHLYEPLIKTLRFFLLGRNEEVVFVMGHLKRWKKESAFFKMARKLFDVDIIHSDPPSNGARVGAVVYRMVGKSRSRISSVSS